MYHSETNSLLLIVITIDSSKKRTIFVTQKFIPRYLRMTETKVLVDNIVAACQEKKAKDIVVIDMRELPGTICQYFVVCEGNTPTQVSAIADEVWDYVRKNINEKPITTDGLREGRWVGIDYGTVIVHILIPELREYYGIEQLWADAKIEKIPNID